MSEWVKCWECGRETEAKLPYPGRSLCSHCRPIVMARTRTSEEMWLVVECKHLVDEALDELEDAGAAVYAYRTAYDDVIARQIRGPMRFRDVPSIKAELVLERSGIENERLKRLLGHLADFWIPELRIVLMMRREEKPVEAAKRLAWEAKLEQHLGKDWAIVHLDNAMIDQHHEHILRTLEGLRNRRVSERLLRPESEVESKP